MNPAVLQSVQLCLQEKRREGIDIGPFDRGSPQPDHRNDKFLAIPEVDPTIKVAAGLQHNSGRIDRTRGDEHAVETGNLSFGRREPPHRDPNARAALIDRDHYKSGPIIYGAAADQTFEI